MATKCFSISIMLFLAAVLVNVAMASVFLDESAKSAQFSSGESEENPYVSVDERREFPEFNKDSNPAEFQHFNFHRSAQRYRSRCPANSGSGSCRNQRDCLPNERCRTLRSRWYFGFPKMWQCKCCVRVSTTTSKTASTLTTDGVTQTGNPTTTRFAETTTELNTLPTISLQR